MPGMFNMPGILYFIFDLFAPLFALLLRFSYPLFSVDLST
jgi:hypothetical protein